MLADTIDMDQCIRMKLTILILLVIDINHHGAPRVSSLTDSTICPQNRTVSPSRDFLPLNFSTTAGLASLPAGLLLRAFSKHEDHATDNKQEKESKPFEDSLHTNFSAGFLSFCTAPPATAIF